jgi:hypothetical protein
MKLIRVKEITSTQIGSELLCQHIHHQTQLKSKSEMFWGKILQPNASTVKITKVA